MENQESGTVDTVSHLRADTLLRFRVGPFRFSVPAVEVEGIIVPPRLTVIPLNPPHSKGVFLYHERLASAISLRSKFGLPDHDDGNLGQLVLGEVKVGLVGFWVDEVYETVDSAELEWRSMPEFIPHAAFESFAVKDGDIVMASTMQKLYDVPAEQMASMLASVRKSFDLPEDVPPVEAEGLTTASETDDEDTFGDLVDLSRGASSVEQETGLESVAEKAASAGADVGVTRPTVVDFPTQDVDSSSKRPESPGNAHSSASVAVNRANPGTAVRSGQPTTQSRGGRSVSSYGAYGAARTTSDYRAGDIHARGKPTRESSAHSLGQSSSRPHSFSGGTYAGSINRFQHENKSAAYTPDNTAQQSDVEKRSGNGIGWLVLILLLLFLGVGYWLWSTSKKEGVSAVRLKPAATETIASPSPAPEQEAGPVDASPGLSEIDTAVPAQVDKQPEVVADNSGGQTDDSEVYRLEGKDVTVTVERKPEQIATEAGLGQAKQEDGNTGTQSQPGYREFVHIVVKGDTLWDIAKKYLKNPFRYPELARLSEIKNPDLIYPGDTVRIRARDE